MLAFYYIIGKKRKLEIDKLFENLNRSTGAHDRLSAMYKEENSIGEIGPQAKLELDPEWDRREVETLIRDAIVGDTDAVCRTTVDDIFSTREGIIGGVINVPEDRWFNRRAINLSETHNSIHVIADDLRISSFIIPSRDNFLESINVVFQWFPLSCASKYQLFDLCLRSVAVAKSKCGETISLKVIDMRCWYDIHESTQNRFET